MKVFRDPTRRSVIAYLERQARHWANEAVQAWRSDDRFAVRETAARQLSRDYNRAARFLRKLAR